MIWLVQLVFDCHDPDAVTQHWGQLLGYRHPLVGARAEEVRRFRDEHPQFEGRGRIDDGELRRMPVYLQRVPEPKVGRNRVRPEVAVPAGLPSSAVPPAPVDPEGNEVLVVDDDRPGAEIRLRSIVFDAVDPERLLHFWSQATGYRSARPRAGERRCDPTALGLRWTGEHFALDGVDRPLRHITGAGAPGPGPAPFDLVPGLAFVEESAPKDRKNRLHLDLHSTDVRADRERLVGLGAEVVRWDTDQVLVDPEGNELCLSGRPA